MSKILIFSQNNDIYFFFSGDLNFYSYTPIATIAKLETYVWRDQILCNHWTIKWNRHL